MPKPVDSSYMNRAKVELKIRCLVVAVVASLLVGNHNATEAQTVITFSPPATITKIAMRPVAFGTWTQGFGVVQLSEPVPAQCPNPWWYLPITGLAGSRALNAMAQVAFQTQSRIESVVWSLDQGYCVINYFYLIPSS